jgi:hypothetical protein
MTTITRRLGMAALAGLALGCLAAPLQAQFRAGVGVGVAGPGGAGLSGGGRFMSITPANVAGGMGSNLFGGYGNPYGYGGFSVQDPSNGYLTGGASVIQAQAQFMVAQQQALLMREQVKQSKQATRQSVINEWLWERQNIPSLEQIRQESRALELNRSRNDPPVNEVLQGASLNTLLDSLEKQLNSSPPIEIDQGLLRHINVMPPVSGAGNFGLLKDGGQLSWPLALRDLAPADETAQLRGQIDSLVQEALKQAANNQQVDAATLRGIESSANQLEELLRKQVSRVPFNQYVDARRFLTELEGAQKVLQTREATKFANGTYSAKGGTVQELVKNMKNQGLRFAPATPGDEASYLALQRLMAEADVAGAALVTAPPPAPK